VRSACATDCWRTTPREYGIAVQRALTERPDVVPEDYRTPPRGEEPARFSQADEACIETTRALETIAGESGVRIDLSKPQGRSAAVLKMANDGRFKHLVPDYRQRG
jgi:hypothetical protein